MEAEEHLDVASGAIVPSRCGELAFRVIKKVKCVDILCQFLISNIHVQNSLPHLECFLFPFSITDLVKYFMMSKNIILV